MKKFLSFLLVIAYILTNVFSIARAVNTNEQSSPWTREKAAHLAKITLLNPDKNQIDSLLNAGSATAAVDLIFPNQTGPDRTQFNNYITTYTSSGFNWGDSNHVTRLYQMTYALDPYEAKRKLFSLFEDIFAVNADTNKDITFKDVSDLHELLYNNMLGNYQTLVKKVLYNNGGKGDYAAGKFLDLFNQKDPKNPNENYARELLQLFLMGEYEPFESKDNNDTRNYEESDVYALAKILTGLESDAMSHALTINPANRYTALPLKFLSGGTDPVVPYYSTASGTIDPTLIMTPVNGNNGLTDNTIEYIFTKRGDQIALFLADRIARFYIKDTPTRSELDLIAQIIKTNNFEMLPTIKAVLALDLVYSNSSMNQVRYKNPLELGIGTIKFLRGNSFSGIIMDPNILDTNLLRRLGWTPYFPGSIFGRDGFDNSLKWSSTSTQSAWMTASNYFTYRTGTGAVDFLTLLGNQKQELTTGSVPVITSNLNSFSGNLTFVSGTLTLGNPIVAPQALGSELPPTLQKMSAFSTEYIYPLDPIESILGGENLELFADDVGQWLYNEPEFLGEEIPMIPEQSTSEKSIESDTSSVVSTGEIILLDTGTTISEILPSTDSGTIMTGDINTGSEIITVNIAPETQTGSVEIFSDVSVIETQTGTSTSTGEAVIVLPAIEMISTGSSVESTGSTISDTGTQLDMTGTLSDTGSLEGTEVENQTRETQSKIAELATLALAPAPPVMISTGSVTLPNFAITTNLGNITVLSGAYQADTRTLTIYSGTIMSGTTTTEIISGSIVFDMNSKLIADTVSANQILDTYENYIYGEKRLPADVRTMLSDFLTHNASGSLIPVAPTNTTYFNTYIRGLLSILLSQPEYVLLTGYDLPAMVDPNEQHFLDNITGKLFFIELYGGNDYLTSIIPKDEYSTYLDYRTNQTGSIAISGSGLVDIGDYYMNSALAYGSGGTPGFKDLYDGGYLKLFNRVGGYRHSNDHDAAAKQISSYDSSTSTSADGAFGRMIKSEFESSNTISLGSKLPNIYRSGHFVNMGGTVILSNPLDQGKYKTHMNTMQDITMQRAYPANTRNLFKDTGRISEIGKLSVSQGGPAGASGDMNSIFRFAKVLMNNNIGRSFYMGGYGGYDTHGDQFIGLNKNLNFVATAVTNFFNEVKDTQDVTIVIFSEFGRTNKTNGDLGTDHGDGGGMYIITSNADLRSQLQAGTYGNMSIKNAKANALGVGIDYRSVFGSVFSSLYNLDPSTYFGVPISLQNDISTTPNDISLLSYSYQTSGQTPILNVEFTVKGDNFSPGKAGYTRLLSGTGLSNQKITRLNEKITPEGYRYTFQINPNREPYFNVESFSNQYAVASFSGVFTGSTTPLVLPNNIRQISQTGTSILPVFGNTTAPSLLSGSGLILESTGSKIVSIPSNNQIKMIFGSGLTNVTELTTVSGSLTWRGGFILGEKLDRDLFIPDNALIVSDNKTIQRQNITHLFKMGADVRGIGMKLNQSIGIEFSGLTPNEDYRAISSEDGLKWNDVELAGRLYRASSTGSLVVNTDHFSFFALLSNSTVDVVPSCVVSASPMNVVNGSGTLLNWTLLNSLTGTLSPGNVSIGASGTLSVVPPINATTMYSITTMNTAGSFTCVASVTASPVVVIPPVIAPPSCTLTASPSSVTDGSGSVLSWTMSGASTGTLNPGNIILGATGSLVIVPPASIRTTYTLAVTNTLGSNFCSTSITSSSGSVVTPPSNGGGSGGGGGSVLVGPGGPGGGGSPAVIAIQPTVKIDKKEAVTITEQKKITPKNTRKLNMVFRDTVESITQEATQVVAPQVVRYVQVARSLTFRDTPRVSQNTVQGYLKNNEQVTFLEEVGTWSRVLVEGIEGYVKSKYLTASISPIVTLPTIKKSPLVSLRGYVNAPVSASVYVQPDQTTHILSSVYRDDSVDIIDRTPDWYEIRLPDGSSGFIERGLVNTMDTTY